MVNSEEALQKPRFANNQECGKYVRLNAFSIHRSFRFGLVCVSDDGKVAEESAVQYNTQADIAVQVRGKEEHG